MPPSGVSALRCFAPTNTESFVKLLTVLKPSPQISPGCGPPVSTTNSSFMVAVPAYSTVHLTFPSPLIFSAVNGHTCVRLYIDANASLGVLLNGYGN